MRARTHLTQSLVNASCVLALAITAVGCGAQQYDKQATSQQVAAAGAIQLAPKVDVVLVEDDTGDMLDGDYAQINSQVETMMMNLAAKNWNYHFTTLPLTNGGTYNAAQITQATSAAFDPNWGSLWQPPYPAALPGAFPTNEDALNPSIFTTFADVGGFRQYSGFLQSPTNSQAGSEPGLYSTLMNFQSSFNGMGFIRPDALLAVIFVGMGNDTSFVNQCWNGNQAVPCDQVANVPVCTSMSQSLPSGQAFPKGNAGACASGALSLNYFESQVQGLKVSPSQLKIYAAVPNENTFTSGGSLCQNGYATPGTRYQQFAEGLGGEAYDICSQSLSSILSDVALNLTSTVMNYVTGYLVMNQEPNPTTIKVTKYPGGNTNEAQNIPMDPSNGWTYSGYLSNTATIIAPVPGNYETGYMVQLHGTALLSGADTATITFLTPGGVNGN